MFVELVFRSEARRHPKKQAWVDFLWGIALSVVLALLWFLFGKSAAGEQLQRLTYQLLQTRLTPGDDDPVPVTLVDISNLQTEGDITPRAPLERLLSVLARFNPKVIGVDIDFSPLVSGSRLTGFVTPHDPKFFDSCLKLRVPVYLGIDRTRALRPDEWLGSSEYSDLAAALIARRDPRAVPVSIGEAKGRTMSAALTGRYERGKGRNEYLDWLLVKVSDTDISGWKVEESLPDYSIIRRLEDRCIRIDREAFKKPDTLEMAIRPRKNDIEGRMLLIGDVALNDDAFPNPSGQGSVPGVLVHASAAYTAVYDPLYRIRESLEPWTDLLLSLILLFIVLVVRWFSSADLNEDKLHKSVTLLFVCGVAVLGISVNRTRILWDGFLVAAIALALDPFADRMFRRFSVWLHS